jgi:adenine specific DNA methylase Mod
MYKDPNIQEELQSISPFWQTSTALMPYQVPANYFEELPALVRAGIEKEAVYNEMELIAPLLNTIPKTTVYQKPVAKQNAPSKIFNIAKWSVAAAFIGFVAAGTFLYNSKTEKVDYAAYIHVDQKEILQNISDSTLLSYIDVHEKLITTPDISTPTYRFENSESLIELSSDQELLEYIETSN